MIPIMEMFNHSSPVLNVHGETRDTVVFFLNDFIKDNVKLGNVYVGVIHGRSSNILRNRVHELLKKNKQVDSFRLDIWNPGMTIVKLKIDKKQ